jgi:hypothetical protein
LFVSAGNSGSLWSDYSEYSEYDAESDADFPEAAKTSDSEKEIGNDLPPEIYCDLVSI